MCAHDKWAYPLEVHASSREILDPVLKVFSLKIESAIKIAELLHDELLLWVTFTRLIVLGTNLLAYDKLGLFKIFLFHMEFVNSSSWALKLTLTF